ncbi:hypothetical protein ACIGDM_00955 [Rothia koreensis]|uniref:phage tail tube protein n=1 Tax=Rothia koreensis TaxID=592378 RepID=UPI0037CBF222
MPNAPTPPAPAGVTAPKTLADGKVRLVYVPNLVNPNAPKISELNAGVDLSCRVLKSDFELGPVDSDTVDDLAALCDESNPTVYGASNFKGSLTVFRWFDPRNPGRHDTQGDVAYQALRERGTQGYLVKRESGKKYNVSWEVGDEVEVYSILTDHPQPPKDAGGFIRRMIPLGVQNGWVNASVAA